MRNLLQFVIGQKIANRGICKSYVKAISKEGRPGLLRACVQFQVAGRPPRPTKDAIKTRRTAKGGPKTPRGEFGAPVSGGGGLPRSWFVANARSTYNTTHNTLGCRSFIPEICRCCCCCCVVRSFWRLLLQQQRPRRRRARLRHMYVRPTGLGC